VCVFSLFFRAAVRAFSRACPAYYCFITYCIYCHFWQINVNVNVNVKNVTFIFKRRNSADRLESTTTFCIVKFGTRHCSNSVVYVNSCE